MVKKTQATTELSVVMIQTGRIEVCLLGTSPLILNAMSEKSRQGLLFPSPTKNSAERAGSLKHDPIEEYRNSVYRHRDNDHPTRLFFPAGAFKKAMSSAALDMPGLKKAQVGRLVWIEGNDIDIYGIPQIYTTVVRSADMNRTPDMRTRAILPQWACRLTINYVRPLLKERDIGTLLGAAGIIVGIGDGRQEKGAFSFGQFEVVAMDDKRWANVTKLGRKGQDAALATPAFYDEETEKLITWFEAERKVRGPEAAVVAKKTARQPVPVESGNGHDHQSA